MWKIYKSIWIVVGRVHLGMSRKGGSLIRLRFSRVCSKARRLVHQLHCPYAMLINGQRTTAILLSNFALVMLITLTGRSMVNEITGVVVDNLPEKQLDVLRRGQLQKNGCESATEYSFAVLCRSWET